MTYFSQFPHIYYDFNFPEGNRTVILRDISINMRVHKELINGLTLFNYYHIEEGDTPELISNKFYGTPNYHWIIMLMNDRFDYIEDFPMASTQLEDYTKEKYGATELSSIHHYEDPNGFEVTNSEKFLDINAVRYFRLCTSESIGGFVTPRITSAETDAFKFIQDDPSGVWQIVGSNLNQVNINYVAAVGNANELMMETPADLPGNFEAIFIRWIDPMAGATAISNLEYETRENERKRRLKILHPTLLPQLIAILSKVTNE